MSNPSNSRQEPASTYFVQKRTNQQEEMTRLRIQDQMLTTGMGGVLAEQPDPDRFLRVLDVGSGTGGWLIETARTYLSISQLVGVDIDQRMVKHAQAEAQGLGERVQFQVMDAMRKLDFPDNSFDLVNERLGTSFLRTWDWPAFLMECQRVVRPGGTARFTEGNTWESSSPALARLNQLLCQALHQSGHLFNEEKNGVADQLERMLNQYGFQNVRTRLFVLEYQAGTEEGRLFFEGAKRVFRATVPFLQKWIHVPDDYDAIYQRALDDLQQPDCVARWSLLTAWGTKRAA